MPSTTVLKPARSGAWEAVADRVTTSLRSRPASIVAMAAAGCPWARRSRLSASGHESASWSSMFTGHLLRAGFRERVPSPYVSGGVLVGLSYVDHERTVGPGRRECFLSHFTSHFTASSNTPGGIL